MDRQELKERFNSGERDFSEVDWTGADLHSLYLKGIILVGANLSKVDLSDALIENSNMEKVCFDGSSLLEVSFQNTNLHQANFDNSILVSAHFNKCNADDASFREADIRMASFAETTLRRTNWTGAIGEASMFTETDFTGCEYEPNLWECAVRVIMPNGKVYTSPWLEERGF
jgi:uncharacterized protein YjbI with pentapeptide repeats